MIELYNLTHREYDYVSELPKLIDNLATLIEPKVGQNVSHEKWNFHVGASRLQDGDEAA